MYLQTPCGIFHFVCWQLPWKHWRKGNAVHLNTFRWCPVGISTTTSINLVLLVIFLSSSRKISGLYLEEVKAASFYILSMSLLKYTLPLNVVYSETLSLWAPRFLYTCIRQAFPYSPENAFYIFNQQIYFHYLIYAWPCIIDINNIDSQLDTTITAY